MSSCLCVCKLFKSLQLDIVGHSGDSSEVPFVQSTNPPANDKERLQVLKVRDECNVQVYT